MKLLIIGKIRTVSRIISCSAAAFVAWETGDPTANLLPAVHPIASMK